MKLTDIIKNVETPPLTEAIQDYEFFIGKDKMVHILQANKDMGAKSPQDFQLWLQKLFPGNFKEIWQQLVQAKKFSGNKPPEDMTAGGQVSQGAGD